MANPESARTPAQPASPTSRLLGRSRFYYGWFLVGVATVCYGFAISPAYYSWGFFGPETSADLGLTRQQTGSIFGLFHFMFSAVGPLVGLGISRFGLRAMMSGGALMSAVGFWLLGRADSVWDCYLGFSLLGGAGIGFTSILPCQTLVTYWFERYRARAMAIVFIGGSLVGMAVNPFNAAVLEQAGWRFAWVIIAGASVGVAILAGLFVRNRPADLGLEPDGLKPATPPAEPTSDSSPAKPTPPRWSVARTLRTPQFALITLGGLAYSVPWTVVSAHGGLHVRGELGVSAVSAAFILGTVRVGVSNFGRLSASFGDFFSPNKVLGIALLIEALGVAVLAFAESVGPLYLAVSLLGFGFGTAYLAVPLTLARYFGPEAFAGTTGSRLFINAIFLYLAPTYAGYLADRTGSYVSVFWALSVLTLAGALASYFCRPPRTPTEEGARTDSLERATA